MRDTRDNGERQREKERAKRQNSVVNREGRTKRATMRRRNMKRRRKRREWARDVRKRSTDGKRNGEREVYTKGEESGPFDGAFVGSRGALRFATKIVALLARVGRSPRRVICCEFINATRARAAIELATRRRFRTIWGPRRNSAHVRIQSSS